MTITIEDRKTKGCLNAAYVVTIPVVGYPAPMSTYPVKVNAGNAEQMLFSLNALCYHPQVNRFIRELIPSPFYPSRRLSDCHLPLEALLNYLARPSNVHCIDWADSTEYIKSYEGLRIRHFLKDFLFPYQSCFTSSFIRSYGEFQWNNRWFQEIITTYLFLNEANNNVEQILERFETWFINVQHYDGLCHDLRNICSSIEKLMKMNLFIWSDEMNSPPYISSIIEENSRLYS